MRREAKRDGAVQTPGVLLDLHWKVPPGEIEAMGESLSTFH